MSQACPGCALKALRQALLLLLLAEAVASGPLAWLVVLMHEEEGDTLSYR
jgi:hypothetical protein